MRIFQKCIEKVNIGDQYRFKPCSFRRGGATHYFRVCGDLCRVVLKRRWQSQKTARLSINDGLATLAEMQLRGLEPKLAKSTAFLNKVVS